MDDLTKIKKARVGLAEVQSKMPTACSDRAKVIRGLGAIKSQQAEIESLRAQQQWVSVEDRLPDFHIQILFYAGNIDGLLKGAFYQHSHRFQDNGGNFFYKSDVTHWMPLPKPPKESDDG